MIGRVSVCVPAALLMFSASVDAQPVQVTPAETVEYAAVVVASRVALPDSDESGVGSRFGDPGDKWVGGNMACAPHEHVNATDFVCAHRYYPCGTILILENQKTGQRSWCTVADRGPYGANVFASDGKTIVNDASGHPAWFIKVHPADVPPASVCPEGSCVGKWRGVIDISPAASNAMGHTGWGYVKVWRLKRIVDFQKYLAAKKSRTTT